MILHTGMLYSDFSGHFDGWYVAHNPTFPGIPYLHPPRIQTHPIDRACSHQAFLIADTAYHEMDFHQRRPYIRFSRRYRRNPYTVFMSSATLNMCGGLYAPDYPPFGNSARTQTSPPGRVYPPPRCATNRSGRSCHGIAILDFERTGPKELFFKYSQALYDPERAHDFLVEVDMWMLYNPVLDVWAYRHHEIMPNQIVSQGYVYIDPPPGDYLNIAKVTHIYKAVNTTAWVYPRDIIRHPLYAPHLPTRKAIIRPNVQYWTIRGHSHRIARYRFRGYLIVGFTFNRRTPTITDYRFTIECVTVTDPHQAYWQGSIRIALFDDEAGLEGPKEFMYQLKDNWWYERTLTLSKRWTLHLHAQIWDHGNMVDFEMEPNKKYTWDTSKW